MNARVEILDGKGLQTFDRNPRGDSILEESTLIFLMAMLNYIFSTGNAQYLRISV
jgi:hypothetical protein